MYKSLLIEHAQKSSIEPPRYQTYNEGAQHQPLFRSRVWIDGAWYTSPNTYSQIKVAEMEVSRIAFLAIKQKQKDEGDNLIRENTVYCKSILAEYADRKKLEKPSYQITQSELSLPLFSSTVVFNGLSFIGKFARSKKEAQRLAAREVILLILDTESDHVMSEIINSKFKLFAKNSSNEVKVAPATNSIPPPFTIIEPLSGQSTSIQVFQPPKPELPTTITISLAPMVMYPKITQQQNWEEGASSRAT